jgi:hypothetical protein
MKKVRGKEKKRQALPATPRRDGYEQRDVKARTLMLAGAILVCVVAVGFLAVAGLIVLSTPYAVEPPSQLDTIVQQAGPRLEVDPEGHRRQRETVSAERIEGYGWQDRQKGIARIPVERAMEILAATGWPDADTLAQGQKAGGP